MDLAFQIQEKMRYLDDNKKRLILEIIDNFIPDDELTNEDLHLIALARQEYAEGDTVGHDEIDWN